MDSSNGGTGEQKPASRKLIFSSYGHALGLADGYLFGTRWTPGCIPVGSPSPAVPDEHGSPATTEGKDDDN